MKTMKRTPWLAAIAGVLVLGGAAAAQNRDDNGVEPFGEQPQEQPGQMVTISNVAEPLELRTIIEMIEPFLDHGIAMDPGVSGSVAFTKPVSVPVDELLIFVSSLLELHGYSIYYDDQTRLYNVVAVGNLPVSFGEGQLATTRVIETPNVRPSSLKTVIDEQVGAKARITYMDELGMIIITGTPGQMNVIERLVERVLAERAERALTRIELKHVNAGVARQRALELIGQILPENLLNQQGLNRNERNVQERVPDQPGGEVTLENLENRLVVASVGNALLFRGRPHEIEEIRRLVEFIDVAPTLVQKQYFTGTQTEAIASYASRSGLGELVRMMGDMGEQGGAGRLGAQSQDVANLGADVQGGSKIVADIYAQRIMYLGTPEQHEQMERLVSSFDPDQDLVVVMPYKLFYAKALELSDVINALLSGQAQLADAPLLGNQGGGAGRAPNQQMQPQQPEGAPPVEGGGISILGGSDIFVVADESNNQVLVRAPQKQQVEFERLIKRLDLRRPQVFLDVKIVAVTWTDDLQLGVELQGINSNGSGGLGFTNFSLSSLPNGVTAPKEVATNLLGLTAAIVNTDEVPIIINAVANTLDGRIVSSPKLLVDDNEESTIKSVQNVPVQTVNQGQVSDQITFGGYEEAGTTLTVTPSISEGGEVRLEYSIVLSSFVGQGSNGLPPVKELREISSGATTVQTDMSVIIGGIEIQDTAKTRLRVPLVGDIPLVGLLFGSRRNEQRKSNLYVFITPRVLRDPTPVDYRLLTRGPQSRAGLDPDLPPIEPISIPLVGQVTMTTRKEGQD